jgi:ATP-dependent helicase HepA
MLGWIYDHTHLGIGKVVAQAGPNLRIRYVETGQELTLGPSALRDGSLSRKRLVPQTRCTLNGALCTIIRVLPKDEAGAHTYEIHFPDGRTAVFSETELEPVPGQVVRNPLFQVQGLEPQPYRLFETREWMVRSYARLMKRGAGFRALLSSRIDLHPHQAYVAGVVTQDSRRRYILADEVGLGKTIEAGIVIHDLLMQNPRARVLVICPGELTQQWLCELYSKFGGYVFRLLDLHAPSVIRVSALDRAIVSTTLATFRLAETLQSRDWDLVVVDEVHHLLHSSALYRFVERLSRQVDSLLLLSAIPAQRREDEYLRLLRLLEPERYQETDLAARERFRELYAAQEDIGRRMRRVARKLEEVAEGEAEREELVRLIERLVGLPVLSSDTYLAERVARIVGLEGDLPAETHRLLDHIAQQYRINRRILRNRRKRLIDDERLKPVERRLSREAYAPEPLEREVLESAEDLLSEIGQSDLALEIRVPFVRVLQQSLLCSTTADTFFRCLAAADVSLPLSPADKAYVGAGHLAGYAEWEGYQKLLCRAVRPHLTEESLNRAVRRVMTWRDAEHADSRRDRVVSFLRDRMEKACPKVLVFAGYPGASEWLAADLRREFGDAVREFRYDLDQQDKEDFVREFQNNPKVWILVSDETGGEGRNFQFVDEILHVDTPWSVARVEQRIGRLDRLGRAEIRADVLSNVVVAEDSLEHALVECYAEGVGVYGESISGLEFALREVEETIVVRASEGGIEALRTYAPEAKQILVLERARDDSEALFDQASFNSAAAERMQRVASSAADEIELEKSFCRYLKAISSHHAVREMNDPRYPGAVWMFRPDEFRKGVLPEGAGERPDLFRPHVGTFRRRVAQERLDLQFFTTGNILFDTVTNSLWEGAVGRSYAIACRASTQFPWIGLEFGFRAEPYWAGLGDRPGLRNRISMVFPATPKSVFVSREGQVEVQARAEALIRTRFKLRAKDEHSEWINLAGNILLDAVQEYWGEDWQGAVQRCYEAARCEALTLFTNRLERDLAYEQERLSEALLQARQRRAEEEEIEAIEALRSAIAGWNLTLDTAGILAINPESAR